jgi:carbonic anhydrase
MLGSLTRRSAMRFIGMGTALVALSGTGPARAASGAPWSYEGADGPQNWGKLDQGYAACSAGQQQSPINLQDSQTTQLGGVQVFWRPVPLEVTNNGHTIQVNCAPGSFIVLEGRRFNLLQFHFHHPSEHTLVGQSYPLEVHFVHQAAEGDLAVLGVMFTAGAASSELKPIWDNAPPVGQTNKPGLFIDIAAMLPAQRQYFRYAGSLTTPPCSETVSWAVFASPVQASQQQIDTFAKVFPNNARPVQPLHRRFILGSF